MKPLLHVFARAFSMLAAHRTQIRRWLVKALLVGAWISAALIASAWVLFIFLQP